jgi:hypothetical protein
MDSGPLASSLAARFTEHSGGPDTMEEARRLVALMAAITCLSLLLMLGLLITLLVIAW